MPVGVLSGYALKRQAVRKTWGKEVCLYFIVGKNDGSWPEEEATLHSDLLLLDMEEVYHGITSILPYKTAIWFYLAHEHFPQAMHVLKTDDDSYVKISGLQDELIQVQPDYWGYAYRGLGPNRHPENKNFVPTSMFPESVFPDFCSGAGYVLSHKALECFVSKIESQTYFACEDVSTGIVMQTCDIKASHSELVDRMGNNPPSTPWLIKHYVKNHSEIIPTATPLDVEA
jgi:beta-1,3-galactosyltransferase 1